MASDPDSSQLENAQYRQTHRRLLAATRELLEEQGFDALTMEKVAASAGVTRRAVYLHFESRCDLVAELFEYVAEAEGLDASISPVWEAPDGPAALDAWAFHLADYHPRILAVSRAMHGIWRSDPGMAPHRKRIRTAKLEVCRRLAKRLHDDGVLAGGWTVTAAADMLDALATNDVIEALTVERGWSQKELAAGLARLFRSTFLAAEQRRRHSGGSPPAATRNRAK
jgi:AcrR family transcriptional regulator